MRGALTRRSYATVGLCTVLAGMMAAGTDALAKPAPPGRLVQAHGPSGCVHPNPTGTCGRARAITVPNSIAVSPDGRNVYVAAFKSNSVAVFRRDPRSGALHQLPGKLGCIAQKSTRTCQFGRALAAPIGVAVSPDGRNVYVAATGSDALSVFARNRRSGAIRQRTGPVGCISNRPGAGCAGGRALNEPIQVAVSPDGKRVYVAARSFPSAVSIFDRRPDGSLRQAPGAPGCVSMAGNGGCTAGRAMKTPWDIQVSPDSRHVYVTGSNSNAVAVLTRTPDGLAQAADASGCVALGAREGCTGGRALGGPVGVTVSPDGKSLYVASIDSDAIAIFKRTPASGALSQAAGKAACVGQSGAARCSSGRVLDGVHDALVSPDGRNVYTISEEINAISVFARSPSGALAQLPGKWACLIRGGVLGCPAGQGLTAAVAIAASPDGRNLYTGSADAKQGAIGIFRRLR